MFTKIFLLLLFKNYANIVSKIYLSDCAYYNHLHDNIEFKYKKILLEYMLCPWYCYILGYDITDLSFHTIKKSHMYLWTYK